MIIIMARLLVVPIITRLVIVVSIVRTVEMVVMMRPWDDEIMGTMMMAIVRCKRRISESYEKPTHKIRLIADHKYLVIMYQKTMMKPY